jgi:nitrate/TMAO reductase-like tetraheme cytochrome c subunit
MVIALPIDEWTAPYEVNEFIGGGLTFWDGPKQKQHSTTTTNISSSNDNNNTTDLSTTNEIHYDTRSGDIAFIDRCVVFRWIDFFFRSSKYDYR